MVGGIIPCFMDKIHEIASTAPAAPRRCPVIDLVEFMFSLYASF